MKSSNEMTNYEKTLEIAKHIYPDDQLILASGKVFISVSDKTVLSSGASNPYWSDFEVDYCNNYNDLIPLMIEYVRCYQINKSTKQSDMVDKLLEALRMPEKIKDTKGKPCKHEWNYMGHGHNYSLYKCKCGEEKEE